MYRILLSFAAFFACVCASARDYSIKVDTTSIPAAAAEVLVQRFTQMLEGGGHTVGEEGPVVYVSGEVKDSMETPGSMSQTALNVVVRATCGSAKVEFPLTGVGSDEADAWLRAAKRLLPRSKEAQAFVSAL